MAQEDEMDGVRVVMSALQLAAVLARRSISPTEMMSNRLWGGWDIVGGVLEMVGAGVLCAIPEPTGLTKAGCVVFGVHGADTAWRGARQVWTGRDTATLTQKGAAKLAETMRAPPDMAGNIGLSLDIGVGFGLAGMLKAARVASITGGRIQLIWHEAKTAGGPGGHTLQKHVGKTEAQLRERLIREPRLLASSSFTDLRTAEFAISEAMRANATWIKSWAAGSGEIKLRMDYVMAKPIGKIISQKTGKIESARKIRVVLLRQKYNEMPYYILTAFPIA